MKNNVTLPDKIDPDTDLKGSFLGTWIVKSDVNQVVDHYRQYGVASSESSWFKTSLCLNHIQFNQLFTQVLLLYVKSHVYSYLETRNELLPYFMNLQIFLFPINMYSNTWGNINCKLVINSPTGKWQNCGHKY